MKRYSIVKQEGVSDFNYVSDSEHGNWIRYEDYEAEKSAMCESNLNAVLDGFRVSAENNYDEIKNNSVGLAIVQHWHTKGRRFAVLKKVSEDDCDFRVDDDNSELSYDWNVIFWAELKDPKTFV